MASERKASGVILEDTEGFILLLKRSSMSLEPNTWGLVGGNVDGGETFAQAATREVREEIRFAINPSLLEQVSEYHWKLDSFNLHFVAYVYRLGERPQDLQLQVEENTEYIWIKPHDALQRQDLMQGLYSILKDQYQ